MLLQLSCIGLSQLFQLSRLELQLALFFLQLHLELFDQRGHLHHLVLLLVHDLCDAHHLCLLLSDDPRLLALLSLLEVRELLVQLFKT